MPADCRHERRACSPSWLLRSGATESLRVPALTPKPPEGAEEKSPVGL